VVETRVAVLVAQIATRSRTGCIARTAYSLSAEEGGTLAGVPSRSVKTGEFPEE
jgi:hypothetical protein